VSNTGSVRAAEADAKPADNVDAARANVRVGRATLALVKTTTRHTPLHAGARVAYRIRVTNTSANAAAGVVVCDALPLSLVWTSAPGGHFRNGRACWTVGLLPAHARRTLQLTARLIRGARAGRLENVATATARNATSRRATASVVVAAGDDNGRRDGGVTG
jgi:uncharacterized repeat protein (TIGR01451 family)